MWHYLFRKPNAKDASAEQIIADLLAEFPAMTHHIKVGENTLAVIPAKVTDDQAATLLDNKTAITGSGMLVWFEPWMITDIERCYQSNVEKGQNGGGRPSLAELLNRL